MDADCFDVACVQQQEGEARQFEVDRLTQLRDRLAWEVYSIYIDRVLDLVVGYPKPF